MVRLRLGGVVVVLGLTVVACTGGESGSGASDPTVADGSASDSSPTAPSSSSSISTSASTSSVSSTSAVASGVSTTTVAAPSTEETSPTTTATPPPGTSPTPTTTVACEFEGSLDEVEHEFPLQMSAEVGADVRTGSHGCFERVVIELASGGDGVPAVAPGYWVRYTTGPLTLGQSDDQFVELAGDADLLITTNAWMTTTDSSSSPIGYSGPIDFVPTNVDVIEQLRMLDNFEGSHTWAVGLDHARPFSVQTLTDPTRIVVDISTE